MLRKSFVLLLTIALTSSLSEAKSYSSGGKSYSSRSSASSSGRSPSRSSSSPSSGSGSSSASRSYSSGKSYSSGSGRTYSPGSSAPSSPSPVKSSPSDSSRTYSSGSSGGKPFTSPSSDSRAKAESKPTSATSESPENSSRAGRTYSSGAKTFESPKPSSSPILAPDKPSPGGSKSPPISFDTSAADAQRKAVSKREFSTWKKEQTSDIPTQTATRRSYSDSPRPPIINTYPQSYRTRPVRIEHYYRPYYSRPVVIYNDPYNSFFWWWLLDRSLEDRSLWAYNHRSRMDAARYQALLESDAALGARVQQLESQRAPVNPNYVPSGLDRDLMYTDREVSRAYSNRATKSGTFFFWLIMVPTAAGGICFLVWLVYYKRWQTASP